MDTDGVVSPGGEPSRREEGRIDDDEGIVSQLSVGFYGRSYLVVIANMCDAFSVTVAAIARYLLELLTLLIFISLWSLQRESYARPN